MRLSNEQIKQIIEGAIMAAGEPMTINALSKLFDEEEGPEANELQELLSELMESYADRGVELKEVGSGYRFQVRAELAPWVGKIWAERPPRYSRALLETLSLIAYKQPITRAEIEDIRGVAVSTNIIRTLLDRQWVRSVGHKDVPGKPMLYATNRKFLDYFNLKSLSELPALNELTDLDKIAEQFELTLPPELVEAMEGAPVEEGAEPEVEPDAQPEAEQEAPVGEPIEVIELKIADEEIEEIMEVDVQPEEELAEVE